MPESPFDFNNFPTGPMSGCAREDRNSQTSMGCALSAAKFPALCRATVKAAGSGVLQTNRLPGIAGSQTQSIVIPIAAICKGRSKTAEGVMRRETAALPGDFCENACFFAVAWTASRMVIFSRKERKCTARWNSGFKSDKECYEKESANAKFCGRSSG